MRIHLKTFGTVHCRDTLAHGHNTYSRVNLQFNPQQIATKGFSTDLGSI